MPADVIDFKLPKMFFESFYGKIFCLQIQMRIPHVQLYCSNQTLQSSKKNFFRFPSKGSIRKWLKLNDWTEWKWAMCLFKAHKQFSDIWWLKFWNDNKLVPSN